jgi:hypothetical protein
MEAIQGDAKIWSFCDGPRWWASLFHGKIVAVGYRLRKRPRASCRPTQITVSSAGSKGIAGGRTGANQFDNGKREPLGFTVGVDTILLEDTSNRLGQSERLAERKA